MARSNSELLTTLQKQNLMKSMISMPTITLNPQEADKFIEYVWDESVMKNNARLVKMDSETKNVRGLGIGTDRILHPGATFSSSDYKTAFDHNTILLTAKELRCCVVIYDSDLEDLTIGSPQQFKATVMSMVVKKLATELEEFFWISDANSLSGFANTDIRSLQDGWRYKLDHSQSGEAYENDVTGSAVILDASNTVTAKAASFSLTTSQGIVEQDASAPYNQEYKFAKMLQNLPSKYKTQGLASLRFILNDQLAALYIENLSNRATTIGDAAIRGKAPLSYGMVPIVQVPLMPVQMVIASGDTQHEKLDTTTPGDLTDCVLTHWKNLIIGIQKKITMESERSAADRANYFFYTLKACSAIENVNACVFTKRLKVA